MNVVKPSTARTLPCFVESAVVRSSLRRRGRGPVLSDDAVAVQFPPGTDTGNVRRPPTSSHVSRAPGAPVADRPANPPPTSECSTSRAAPRDQLRRPDRFHLSADRRVHDRHVFRNRRRCSAALLLRSLLLVTFTVYVRPSLLIPSFSYSPLGPLCFPLLLYPWILLVSFCVIVGS